MHRSAFTTNMGLLAVSTQQCSLQAWNHLWQPILILHAMCPALFQSLHAFKIPCNLLKTDLLHSL